MKQIGTWIGIVVFLLVWSGCRDESEERRIVYHAASYWEADPDSVLHILDSIPLPEELSQALATEWSMLYARAADKAGKDMPYVNQMQVAVNRYKKKDQLPELAEAYLYLGRSYVEDKAFDKAALSYQSGLDIALQIADYNRAGYICSYWATLYEISGEYDQAIEKFELSNSYFQQAGNQKSYVFGLVNEACMFIYKEENQLALDLLLKADSVATSLNDIELMVYVCNGLGNIYYQLNEYDLAESYVLRGIKLDSTNVFQDNNLLFNIYHFKGNEERAMFHLEKAKMHSTDDVSEAAIHYNYYKMEKKAGHFEKALHHYEKYEMVNDSLLDISKNINLLEIEKKFNHYQLQNENKELKFANQRKLIGLLIILFICLFLLVIYLLMLRRKNLHIARQQQMISQKNMEIYKVSVELQQKKEELRQQTIRMEEAKQLIHLEGDLEEEQSKYEVLKESVERLNSHLMTLKEEQLLQSAVAKKLLKMSQSVKANDSATLISDRYWRTIEELIMKVYPTLQENLKDLTLAEQHICYLTLFKLDTKAMSVLLQINPDSVNKQRFRARQKLGLVGKEIDLYDYLRKY